MSVRFEIASLGVVGGARFTVDVEGEYASVGA
jgi:hypothetical protein